MSATPRVLVVEPYEDARELYRLALGLDGVPVDTAATAAEALEIARRSRPAVVLLELRLPDADGLVVAAELLRSGEAGRPEIVALSSDLTTFSAERALDAGCALFLPKPCAPDVIVREVRQALR